MCLVIQFYKRYFVISFTTLASMNDMVESVVYSSTSKLPVIIHSTSWLSQNQCEFQASFVANYAV